VLSRVAFVTQSEVRNDGSAINALSYQSAH
jgi:hypothetical protein